jgi:hypothetical protein
MRTEMRAAGNGAKIIRAAITEARIESENAAGQIHCRPESQAPDEALEFCASFLVLPTRQGFGDQNRNGADGQSHDQDDKDQGSLGVHGVALELAAGFFVSFLGSSISWSLLISGLVIS